MNAIRWISFAASLAFAGCSQSTETNSTQKAMLTAKDMTAQIDALAKTVDPAPLPSGDYPMYCVGNKRARVLGIDPNMKEGWPTAPRKTVVLAKSFGGSANCTDLGLVSDKDELTIDGTPPNFTMHFKHNGVILDRPLTAAPNVPTFPMWFQTAAFDTAGIQYFVYMLDHTSASPALKDQIYLVEAFSQSDKKTCLAERPVYGTNVIAISNSNDCEGAFLQNGTGTGAEPK